MIKNIFFDLDGTIINSEEGVLEGIRLALKKFGYEVPEYSTLRKCIGPPFSYSFPNILGVKDEDFEDAVKCYRKFYDSDGIYRCKVYEGIEDLLKALVNRGYSLNICSSKPEVACKKLLAHLGIDKYFSDIVGATLDGRIETKEQVIDECFARAPWKKKEETVLIGDTKYDALGAFEKGISCIGITWGFGTKEELVNAHAIEAFDTCQEVLEYIEQA